jgi:L-lactate utilization protein LutB
MYMAYDTLASSEAIQRTMDALTANGFLPELVQTRAEALDRIKGMIPVGVSVMNGSSRTLEEIGFIEYLKNGKHDWDNLHADIVAETDPAKQATLRKQSVLSDVYLGRAHV